MFHQGLLQHIKILYVHTVHFLIIHFDPQSLISLWALLHCR